MKKLFATVLMTIGLFSHVATADIGIKEVVNTLSASVVELRDNDTRICTASKIGTRKFVTAWHCLMGRSNNLSIKGNGEYANVISIEMPIGIGGASPSDWGTFTVSNGTEKIATLQIGCTEDIYVGMPIATMGYPQFINKAFFKGYISNFPTIHDPLPINKVVMDMTGAPGISGAPVISTETGSLVGLFVSGINSNFGVYATGMTPLKYTNLCQ